MTGYGAGSAPLAGGNIQVEVRTVNHRHADLRVRAHGPLSDHAASIEQRIRPRIARGRAEVQARWEGAEVQNALDMDRARQVLAALATLRDEVAPGDPLPMTTLSAVPGLFQASTSLDADELKAALDTACETACDALDTMRDQEGAALGEDLSTRLSLMRDHVAWIAPRRTEIVQALRIKLRKRVDELLEGTGAKLDSGRLEQEVALLADRSDVAEEITRLVSHFDQFTKLLGGSEGPVGRRMDFLVQEMGREINTIGSKANDAELSHRVVDMKSELERLREQIQNVL